MNAESPMKLHERFHYPTDPIPARCYTSQEYYDREIEEIYRKDWLWVARDEEIPNPGDYKVKRLEFAKTAIILMRGKDGKVRAFHNICRHRGNKVVAETGEDTFGRNKAAVLTCRFHGWVYGADGSLIQVPEREKFPSCFHDEENGLLQVAVDTWQGFIFINLDPNPKRGLIEFLGGVRDHLDGYPFESLTHVHTYYAHIKCNWKVGLDAFTEGYHVPTIHAGSFPGLGTYWLGDNAFYGDHGSLAFYSQGMNPPTPVGTLANSVFAGSIALERQEGFTLPPGVNPERSPNWGFEQTFIFPNTMIHVGEGLWFTHQFWPISQDSCFWEGKYFLRAPKTNSEQWAQRYAVILQRNAWLEDTATMEDTQTALRAGVLPSINLQDDEIMLRHTNEVIKRRVGKIEEFA